MRGTAVRMPPDRLALELENPRCAGRWLPRTAEDPTRTGVNSSSSPNMESNWAEADRGALRLAEEDLGPAEAPGLRNSHMDRLEEVDELISETESLQYRQRLLHQWIEWSQQDIPSFTHPVFADLLYEQERWRTVFSQAQKEVQDWKDKKRSFQELSWRGLFFLSLDMAPKDAKQARKILSMAIQKQGSAASYVRILGWMNQKESIPHHDLWRLYLGQNPTGFAAKKVREEIP